MRASQDFNYKVALASGLRSLRAGRLRQAEEQFRYLATKFPSLDGGYRGLARVLVELDDRGGALGILRDGASALAKAGERDEAIALLREAIGLDPRDLGTHRRLAAVLALKGDLGAASAEVGRYVDIELEAGEPERARLEVEYAMERLGEHPRLTELGARVGARRATRTEAPTAHREVPATDGEAASKDRDTAATDREAPATDRRQGTARDEDEQEPSEPLDGAAAEARAADLIARRDARAGPAAVQVARTHLAEGRTSAASDLLLQLIASGLADHEAHRALVEVMRAVGKPEVAREKCELLAEALRLEGQEDLADEVDRLAEAV